MVANNYVSSWKDDQVLTLKGTVKFGNSRRHAEVDGLIPKIDHNSAKHRWVNL